MASPLLEPREKRSIEWFEWRVQYKPKNWHILYTRDILYVSDEEFATIVRAVAKAALTAELARTDLDRYEKETRIDHAVQSLFTTFRDTVGADTSRNDVGQKGQLLAYRRMLLYEVNNRKVKRKRSKHATYPPTSTPQPSTAPAASFKPEPDLQSDGTARSSMHLAEPTAALRMAGSLPTAQIVPPPAPPAGPFRSTRDETAEFTSRSSLAPIIPRAATKSSLSSQEQPITASPRIPRERISVDLDQVFMCIDTRETVLRYSPPHLCRAEEILECSTGDPAVLIPRISWQRYHKALCEWDHGVLGGRVTYTHEEHKIVITQPSTFHAVLALQAKRAPGVFQFCLESEPPWEGKRGSRKLSLDGGEGDPLPLKKVKTEASHLRMTMIDAEEVKIKKEVAVVSAPETVVIKRLAEDKVKVERRA